MTAVQTAIAKWAIIILVLFFAGYGVRDYMADAESTRVELKNQRDKNATLAQYSTDLLDLTVRNQALRNTIANLDEKHSKDLHDQLAENNRLRNDLALAGKLRLKGTTCPKQAPAASDPASTAGLDDGAAVVLSGETGLAVFDIRADILRDRKMLQYLQAERRKLTCEPKSG